LGFLGKTEVTNPSDRLRIEITADGSNTFFSEQFQECFHSTFGAKQEAEMKFVLPSLTHLKIEIEKGLENDREKSTDKGREIEIAKKIPNQIQILDLCYGLGYNTAAALEYLQDLEVKISIIGLENNLEVAQSAYSQGLLDIWQHQTKQRLGNLAVQKNHQEEQIDLRLIIGDARQTISQIPTQWADAIFLDPFSPKHCPQLWTIDFLRLVSDRLKPSGYLVTYSCATAMRSALKSIGLYLWSTPPLGRKAPGTIASWQNRGIPERSQSLGKGETEVLETRAGIPYRDPGLCDQAAEIIERHQSEQNCSNLRSTSKWLKQHLREKAVKHVD
jgi:tRNA U34 5-methylaminomethyl-2-thiouridine-forming methyltransferase MnmC